MFGEVVVQESLIDQDSCRKLVAVEKVSISNFYKRDCGGIVNELMAAYLTAILQ